MSETFFARPPAQGIRVRTLSGGQTGIHILDDNGLGYAYAVLFLTVEVAPDWSRITAPAAEHDVATLRKESHSVLVPPPRPDDEKAPQRAGSYVLATTLPAPIQAKDALVLLLYYASISRGFAVAKPHDDAAPIPEEFWPAIKDAVRDALRDLSKDALLKGVMAGAGIARRSAEPGGPQTFILGSCLYPCDILDHMPDGQDDLAGPADASLLLLGGLLERSDWPSGAARPSVFVMAGDQVYVDATAGLFDPKSLDDRYRIPYQTLYASRGAQEIFGRRDLEIHMVIDDHEIADNWEPKDPTPLKPGVDAYWDNERPGEKPCCRLWSALDAHGLAFFLGDTRTEREARTARDFPTKRIMSERQRLALSDWLQRRDLAERHKFVVTPSIVLPRRLHVRDNADSALRCDSWAGYPLSLYELIAELCEQELANVVFLSGDEHVSCVARVTVKSETTGKQVRFHSIHSSGLYTPYPFANSRVEDFPGVDVFTFELGHRRYACRVETDFVPGDGFALITTQGGSLQIDFYRPNLPGGLAAAVRARELPAAVRARERGGAPTPPLSSHIAHKVVSIKCPASAA